jgi:sugar phosphate isomerase/epimerase
MTRKIGFDTVDLHTDPYDIDVRERRLIRETAAALQLPIKSVCCVATGLADFNPSIQRFHLARTKAYLDLCHELRCDNLLLVVGEYLWSGQVIPPGNQWATCVRNVRECGRYARSLGLRIVIELEPFEMSLINTVDTMQRFLDDVDQPGVVEANCDISHLYLMGIKPREIRRLAGRIGHVHLSDCDGKVHGDLPPGRGVVPIEKYLREIRQTGFDGVVSVELEYAPDPRRIVAWVTEAYEQTARIMERLGCRG